MARRKFLKYTRDLDNLISISFVSFSTLKTDEVGNQIPIKDKCQITEKGLCYLQYCYNHFVDVRTPIMISIFALLVSVVGLIIAA